MVGVDIAHHVPAQAPPRRELHVGALEERAARAGHERALVDGLALAEAARRVLVQRDRGGVEPDAPDQVGAQRLGGLRAIDDACLEAGIASGSEPTLAAGVGVDEAAHRLDERQPSQRGLQVDEPIEDRGAQRLEAGVADEGHGADEAERPARGPAGPQREAQRGVDLLEHEALAELALVEVALDAGRGRAAQWLPHHVRAQRPDEGHRPAQASGAVQPVIRLVREQRPLRRHPPGREGARGRRTSSGRRGS